jgi:hypothetical protein
LIKGAAKHLLQLQLQLQELTEQKKRSDYGLNIPHRTHSDKGFSHS